MTLYKVRLNEKGKKHLKDFLETYGKESLIFEACLEECQNVLEEKYDFESLSWELGSRDTKNKNPAHFHVSDDELEIEEIEEDFEDDDEDNF